MKQVQQFRGWSRPKPKARESPGEPDLFSRAREDRDDALERVEANAEPEAIEAWWAAMQDYVAESPFLFCDDFIAWGEQRGLARLSNMRALGPLYIRAQKQGLIRDSGETRKSVRSHLSRKPVWESLAYARGASGAGR